MISPVGGYVTNYYPAIGSHALGTAVNPVNPVKDIRPLSEGGPLNTEKVQPSECQTCKNRKYVDQSNESVSFKTPTHISPQASYGAVAAHEQEHVANAVSEGSEEGKQLVSSSVTLKMDVCPECGSSYVAGGVTRTQIQYDASNPYENSRKSAESSLLKGLYVNFVA